MLVDLQGVRRVLAQVASEVLSDMHAAVPVGAEAAMHGAVILRDRQAEALAVDHWEAMDREDIDDCRERVERFCFWYCPRGQQMRPGMHPKCGACPLITMTTEALARQVAKARED